MKKKKLINFSQRISWSWRKNDESEAEGKKFVEEAIILGNEKEEEEYEVGGYKYGKTCVEALM